MHKFHGKWAVIALEPIAQWTERTRWWAREDSNLQPSGYEPPALTIELQAPGSDAYSRTPANAIPFDAKICIEAR